VEFGQPRYGWLPIKIAAGKQAIAFRASDLDCPFPRILGWLEKLIKGEHGRMKAADLAVFSRKALRAWLWKLYPAYVWRSEPQATPSIVQGYERVEGVLETPDPHRTPFYLFDIDAEYDDWTFSQRADYIADLLRKTSTTRRGLISATSGRRSLRLCYSRTSRIGHFGGQAVRVG
jgi:hypothetical protein